MDYPTEGDSTMAFEIREGELPVYVCKILNDLVLIYSGDVVLFCNDAGLVILEADSLRHINDRKFIRLIDTPYRALFEGVERPFGDQGEKKEVIFITLRFRKIWMQVRRFPVRYKDQDAVLLYACPIDYIKHLEEEKKNLKNEVNRMLLEGLTRREREILELYGHGKNRVAISRELDVEEGTIDRHTTNIKKKLRMKSMKLLLNFAMDLQNMEDQNQVSE